MTKRLLLLGSMTLLFIACKKEQALVKETPVFFNNWLMQNARYSIAESTTGTIVFNTPQLKLDGQIVNQRGVYYFLDNPDTKTIFPAIKETNAKGYTRDIQIGSSISYCNNYRVQASKINLRIIAGEKIFTWQDCPVAILEHESLPSLSWAVNVPKNIEIILSPSGTK